MPITQQSFAGASIRNFSCAIGWGSQSSSLTINLVEDPSLSQAFSPPLPGHPAYFTYDDFAFGGIIQAYKRKNSTGGYPVFEVTMVDPRDILEGVQIIIDGYTGTIGTMPNLFNVYGHLENISFGNAEVNADGILTSKLRTGIDDLIGIGLGSTPINYFGVEYYIDLSYLPTLPTYHRLGGGVSLSLMDIISRICEDGACDYFVTLYQGPIGENVIKVHTINRFGQPDFGKINDFINANTSGEAVQNEGGLELRNEVVGKFLVGGNVSSMYFQQYAEGEAGFRDDTICQFWGLDAQGQIIIQEAFETNNPKFTLDSRGVTVVGVGATYPTDVDEMRVALGGQTAWEMFINAKDQVNGSPHQGKATALGCPNQADLRAILAGIPNINIPPLTAVAAVQNFFNNDVNLAHIAAFTGRNINRFDRGDLHQENITALYQYVSAFANEYYGKKFMVRILDIEAKLESDTNRIVTNYETTDGGFIDEAQYAGAIGNGWMPADFDRVSLDDGRLQAYVKFDNADTLDLSELNPDDYVLDANQVYVKCTVDPGIGVLNIATLESPRVVVTLPGRIFANAAKNDHAGALKDILGPPLLELGVDREDLNTCFKTLLTKWGADKLMFGKAGLAIRPFRAIVPLKSNVNTYGPWYVSGAAGKIEFEQNTELVPWNYGGFTVMNQVGNALVNQALAGQIRAETGSITIPNGPDRNIGTELIAGGPYITSVNVEVGEQGVTSTYRMETWTPRFGKLAKLNTERMAKLGRENAARRKQLRQLAKIPPPAFFDARAKAKKLLDAPPRQTNTSSHTLIGGQIHKATEEDDETRFNEIAIIPEYNAYSPLSNDYGDKALMSLDGLFRPFSTKQNDEDVPHYETPESGAEKTVEDLDPFKTGNDISIVARDTELEEDTDIRDMTSPDQRPVGLRMPLIGVGWGYDTNGKPVPNEHEDSATDPSDEFYEDYLTRSDKWKCGPVDLRWDRVRKVWAAGLGANIRVIKLAEDLQFGGVASGTLQTLTLVGTTLSLAETDDVVTVGEVLGYSYYDTVAVVNGKNVLAIQSNEVTDLYILQGAFLE